MIIGRAPRTRKYPQKLIQSIALFVLSISLGLMMLTSSGHSADITLAWNANSETDIAGYKVYYGTASQNYDWVLDIGKVTTYTVTGLTSGSNYYFAVTAYDTSDLESTYSNQVSASACTYSISPQSENFTASGGTGFVRVSTQSGCSWTASSGVSWMTITSGNSGTGNGTVSYSISSNTNSSPRTASSTIARNTLTVTQAGSSSTTYTITSSAGTGGTISPSGAVTVTKGTNRTFTITPISGYSISGVTVDGSSVGTVGTYTFSNVTANHTISASFKADTTSYTITSSAGTGGTISPSGAATVTKGTNRTFTITPNSGYSISGVTVDGSSVGTVGTYTFSNVTANHTISASFKADTTKYTLTVKKLGTGTGTITNNPSGSTFSPGTVVTLTASPDAGSSFAGWSGGCSGTSPTCRMTMNANVSVTASFTLSQASSNMTITSPDGGEILSTGSTWSITWTAPSEAVRFNIFYSTNNGSSWRTIARNVTGTSYQWHIPVVRNNKQCKVRVVGYNARGEKIASDISAGTFAIQVVRLTSLNGGQELTSGTSSTIQWTTYSTARDVANAKLMYTLNGGRRWKKIESLSSNPGSYTWTVPDADNTLTECKVKVILKAAGGATVGSDESDDFFSINPAS
jgi:hypothetical protein